MCMSKQYTHMTHYDPKPTVTGQIMINSPSDQIYLFLPLLVILRPTYFRNKDNVTVHMSQLGVIDV